MTASTALTLYVPPETRLALVRRAAPIPQVVPLTVAYGPWLYEVGMDVVVPQKQYAFRFRQAVSVTTFQEAKIVGRFRVGGDARGYENYYSVHFKRQEGSTVGYKAFAVCFKEADVSLDLSKAILVMERRIGRNEVVGARGGVSLAA